MLEPNGTLVAGFIEAGGEIFQKYRHEPIKGMFLRFATFRTIDEVYGFFNKAGIFGYFYPSKSALILRVERAENSEMTGAVLPNPKTP